MQRFRPISAPALAVLLCALPVAVRAEDLGARSENGASAAQQEKPADRWAALRGFLGAWQGRSSGEPGNGTVRREYHLVLGDRFIEVRNRSVYPPQERNPKGEVHEDLGYVSVDRARSVLVLRQFHVEGFVNTYTAPATRAGAAVVFTTEAIENIGPGWRARETYRFEGQDVLVERFELAEPGKDFAVYTETRLQRVR